MSSFRNPAPGQSSGWSIERVVALFTPVFAAAAGLVVSATGQLIPGVGLSKGDITALFITGATAAVGAALKWLHGRQKFVNFTVDADHVVQEVVKHVQSLGGAPLVDVEAALKMRAENIIDAIGQKIGAPASAEEIAKQVVQELIGQRQAAAPGGTAGPAAGQGAATTAS